MTHTTKHGMQQLVLFATIILFITLGWMIGRAFVSNTRIAVAQQPPPLVTTPENLKPLGLVFNPIEPKDKLAQGAILRESAVATALKEMPSLKAASGVDANLGIISDPGLQQAASAGVNVDPRLAKPSLVWAITFHGIESVSSGPPDVPKYHSNDFVVVIDAKTGDFIMAFPITDVAQLLPSSPGSNPILTPAQLNTVVAPPEPVGTPSIVPTEKAP